MDTWERKRLYTVFTENDPLSFSITHHFDITAFLRESKARGEKFFPKILHGLTGILNAHKEFKAGINAQDEPGYYDVIHPCYTVFHPEHELITLLWTEFHEDYSVFLQRYTHDMETYAHKPFEMKELSIKNFYHISNAPWLPFSNVSMYGRNKVKEFAPMFTLGKYTHEDHTTRLPFAIHANHAFIDGFHVARLFHELQEWLNHCYE